MSWDNPGPTVEGEAAKRVQAAREQAARELADRTELDRILSVIGTPDGKRAHADFLLRRPPRVRATWTHSIGPLAVPSEHRLYAPPIVDDETYVIFLHEWCHAISGECPRVAPHLSVLQADGKTSNCLACESAAWRGAMTLTRFTPAMFETLRRSLLSYKGTASWSTSARELEFLVSADAFAEHQRAHDRRDRQRQVEQEVERESARSRARWERLYG